VLFAVGGIALAEVPPFATFLGKGLIEDDGVHMGYWWMPLLFAGTSALVGAAVLRMTGRVFLGWGPDEPDRFGADLVGERESSDDDTEHPPKRRTPALLLIVPALLLAGALALGLVPGLSAKAGVAAAQFEDRTAYAAAVFGDGTAATPSPATEGETEPPGASAFWYGIGSGVVAVGLAGLALFRRRWVPAPVRRRVARVAEPVVVRFRALQSGHLGDYTAWLVAGAAALGGLLAAAVR
jgi:multicomponent Na+:H+ antiporter subunit D